MANFPDWLEGVLNGKFGSSTRKLVFCVDDLDRCSNSFIGNILDALQRLNSVKNLFIFICVDREVLMTALRERYQEVASFRDEYEALEKYVQCSFHIPDISQEQVTGFVRKLLERMHEDEEDQVMKAIKDSAFYFPIGLKWKTPRTIKRIINAIRPEIAHRLSTNQQIKADEPHLIVKEQILAYNWPLFYQDYVKTRDSRKSAFFKELEQLCHEHYLRDSTDEPSSQSSQKTIEKRNRRAIFDFHLENLKKREGLPDDVNLSIPDELAALIAQPPYLHYQKETRQTPGESKYEFEPPTDRTEDFSRYYVLSEQAEKVGDSQASVEAAANAYSLVQNNRIAFGKSVAGQLGNLGLNAEKFKAFELAERIWRLALEIDPNHAGCMQQFADYIVDNRADLYEEAESILTKLRSDPHRNHRPFFTFSILAKLRSAQGVALDETVVGEVMEMVKQESEPRQIGHGLAGLVRANAIQQALELYKSEIVRFTDKSSRYTITRVLADAMAIRNEAENERIAMDLYCQILTHLETMDEGDLPDVMANYATLLDQHGYSDEAGCLRFKAYNHPNGRNQSNIKQSYYLYLMRANRLDLAQKALEGEPTEEMVLVPSSKVFPEKFSTIDIPDFLGDGRASVRYRCLRKGNDQEGSIGSEHREPPAPTASPPTEHQAVMLAEGEGDQPSLSAAEQAEMLALSQIVPLLQYGLVMLGNKKAGEADRVHVAEKLEQLAKQAEMGEELPWLEGARALRIMAGWLRGDVVDTANLSPLYREVIERIVTKAAVNGGATEQ
ncbi:MAG: hypothetical protein HC884_10910 [Chloroflexaceae bacterium]|nr:hypothetical protein [Chloroflexaceae bacterium]